MQSIGIDADASKGRSEEVSKVIDISLNQIYTYRYDGGRTFLIGQTTASSGGGVTDNLSSELKNAGRISFFYRIVSCCMHAQYKTLYKSVEQVYGEIGIGEVSSMQLFHRFFLKQEALGESFKDTWVIVNPNSPMPFLSGITKE